MSAKEFLRKFGILIVLVLLCVFFSITTGGTFLKPGNLINVTRQVATIGICSVGMTIVMITGGIELSVGSMQGFVGVVTSLMMVNWGFPIWLAILLALALGVLVGLFHGFVINQLGIPPMITTLATYTTIRGLAYVISGGIPIFGFDEAFKFFGQGYILFIPVPVVTMAIIMVLGYFFLNKTTYGRYVYGIGGNEEACRLSGVNIKKMKYLIYSISGFLASVAAITLLSRINSGQPKAGTGFEFDVITAVVLGGVSIKGGSGNIFGVLIGVLIMGVLKNGLVLMNINEYFQMVIQGLVLIAAVSFDIAMSKQKKLSKEKIAEEALKA